MRISTFLLTLLLSASLAVAQDSAASSPDANNLRVLLVSHDPASPKVPFANMAKERTYRLYRERAASWEALLRYHFESVQVVYGHDYHVAMSDTVDVTVFDARPKALAEAKRGKDPVTGKDTYEAASYLPESFDRPAILIADNAPRIGEPLGLKLDWL